MKKALMFSISILFAIACFSQTGADTETPKGTTQEEYNYLTKGYKIQLESGLDTKRGYEVKPINKNNVKTTGGTLTSGVTKTIEFLELYRIGEKKPCAILCIIGKAQNASYYDTEKYICIPSAYSTKEIRQLCQNAIFSLSKDELQVFSIGMEFILSLYAAF